MTKTEIWKF